MNDLYLDSDGTLGISADVDISKVRRILLTQEGTHYGSMYYQDLPDMNVGDMNNSEIPNSCNFKPGDKFILEIGKRQLDEFEITGTDYYIKIHLLKMLAPYNPEQNTETRRVVAVGDVVYRQQAIDAVNSLCDSCDSGYCGDCRVNFPGEMNCTTVLMGLPPAQPDHIAEVSKKVDSDLISRQAAIDALDGKIEITGRTNAEAVKGYVRLVKDRLERLPSAQPDIIHCKDCKWKNQHNCTRAVELFIDDDKYCAWAERKT